MVEEEARCYLLHEDLRAVEGRRTKGHLVAAPGSPAFPANFACTSIRAANPMTIAVSGESAEQKPPSVSADYQH